MNMVRRDVLNQGGPNQSGAGQDGPAQPAPRVTVGQRPAGAPSQAVPTATPSANPTGNLPARPALPMTRPGLAPARPATASLSGATRPVAPSAARPATPGRATSPTAKADELAAVMRQLTELLTKENAALKKHKMEDVKALTERKEQLARLYQGHMNAVHKDKTILAGLDSARRSAFAQAAMKLGQLMQDNASLLKANIESINLFFKAVTDALKNRHEERSAAYSRSGALGQYAVTKRSLAVSFNQTM